MKIIELIYREFHQAQVVEELILNTDAGTVWYTLAAEDSEWAEGVSEPYFYSNGQEEVIRGLLEAVDFSSWRRTRPAKPQEGALWLARLKDGDSVVKVFSRKIANPKHEIALQRFVAYCRGFFIFQMVCNRKPASCPYCGSDDIRPYSFGLPTGPSTKEDPYLMGGCVISPDSPTWGCVECGMDFRKLSSEDESDA